MSGLSGLDSDPEGSVIADCVAYGAMPGKKSVSGCLNTWSWAIAANSANPDAAWEAVKYLTSADVEKQMAVQTAILPQLPALSSDADVLAAEPFLPALSEQMANGKDAASGCQRKRTVRPAAAALSEIAASGADPVEVFNKLQNDLADTVKLS